MQSPQEVAVAVAVVVGICVRRLHAQKKTTGANSEPIGAKSRVKEKEPVASTSNLGWSQSKGEEVGGWGQPEEPGWGEAAGSWGEAAGDWGEAQGGWGDDAGKVADATASSFSSNPEPKIPPIRPEGGVSKPPNIAQRKDSRGSQTSFPFDKPPSDMLPPNIQPSAYHKKISELKNVNTDLTRPKSPVEQSPLFHSIQSPITPYKTPRAPFTFEVLPAIPPTSTILSPEQKIDRFRQIIQLTTDWLKVKSELSAAVSNQQRWRFTRKSANFARVRPAGEAMLEDQYKRYNTDVQDLEKQISTIEFDIIQLGDLTPDIAKDKATIVTYTSQLLAWISDTRISLQQQSGSASECTKPDDGAAIQKSLESFRQKLEAFEEQLAHLTDYFHESLEISEQNTRQAVRDRMASLNFIASDTEARLSALQVRFSEAETRWDPITNKVVHLMTVFSQLEVMRQRKEENDRLDAETREFIKICQADAKNRRAKIHELSEQVKQLHNFTRPPSESPTLRPRLQAAVAEVVHRELAPILDTLKADSKKTLEDSRRKAFSEAFQQKIQTIVDAAQRVHDLAENAALTNQPSLAHPVL
ncbi:hypothetical protein C8J56DRAFT_1159435 [Mycena floridula]|nr:hypothetical protein C8J56DRAFT_1159435 [Mycena floridula]